MEEQMTKQKRNQMILWLPLLLTVIAAVLSAGLNLIVNCEGNIAMYLTFSHNGEAEIKRFIFPVIFTIVAVVKREKAYRSLHIAAVIILVAEILSGILYLTLTRNLSYMGNIFALMPGAHWMQRIWTMTKIGVSWRGLLFLIAEVVFFAGRAAMVVITRKK